MLTPENEMGVVVYFSQHCTEFGYEIESIGALFPDAVIRNINSGNVYRAEFEFYSSSFKKHGHNPHGCDLIISWINDWGDIPMTVWELSKNLAGDISTPTFVEREYIRLLMENAELKSKVSALQAEMEELKLALPSPEQETVFYHCDDCDFSSETQNALNAHKRVHSNGHAVQVR